MTTEHYVIEEYNKRLCHIGTKKNPSYLPKAVLQNLLVQQILNSHKQLCVPFKTFALLKCWLISAVLLSNLWPAENILWCCFPPASFEVARKCRDETRYCKMQFWWILPWKGHCLWAQGRWKRLGTVSGTVCKQYPKHQMPKSQSGMTQVVLPAQPTADVLKQSGFVWMCM